MGWQHINQNLADTVNGYYKNFFNPYLNFHRPCGFPTVITDTRGKKKKVYRTYKTPYDALRGIPGASGFLKPGQSFTNLDTIAFTKSDNEFAEGMREEERRLFEIIMKTDHRDGFRAG